MRHEQGPPYWHAVARVTVEVTGFGPLHLVSAHLAPSSPTQRLIEAEALTLIAKDGWVIAGGDWNAVPAADPDPPLGGVDTGHARRKLDRAAAQAIEEAGFTDVAAHLGDTTPTVGHFGPDKLAQRELALDRLRHPPEGGWSVIANIRCLGEGMDVISGWSWA